MRNGGRQRGETYLTIYYRSNFSLTWEMRLNVSPGELYYSWRLCPIWLTTTHILYSVVKEKWWQTRLKHFLIYLLQLKGYFFLYKDSIQKLLPLYYFTSVWSKFRVNSLIVWVTLSPLYFWDRRYHYKNFTLISSTVMILTVVVRNTAILFTTSGGETNKSNSPLFSFFIGW